MYKRDNLGQGYTPNVSKYGGWMQQTISWRNSEIYIVVYPQKCVAA